MQRGSRPIMTPAFSSTTGYPPWGDGRDEAGNDHSNTPGRCDGEKSATAAGAPTRQKKRPYTCTSPISRCFNCCTGGWATAEWIAEWICTNSSAKGDAVEGGGRTIEKRGEVAGQVTTIACPPAGLASYR